MPRASRSTRATTSGCCIGRARSRATTRPWPRRRSWSSTRRGRFSRPGAARPPATNGRSVNTASMSTTRDLSGSRATTVRPTGCPGSNRVADDQILKFTQDGKFVMQIGRSNQSTGNADTRNVHRAADVWAYPRTGELFVADGYGNHRVVVFDENTGAFKRMWGAFGNKPADDDHCDVVAPQSVPDGPGPQNFSTVHAIRVANGRDGLCGRPGEPASPGVHERWKVSQAAGQGRYAVRPGPGVIPGSRAAVPVRRKRRGHRRSSSAAASRSSAQSRFRA